MVNLFTERRQLRASAWFHKLQSEGLTADDWREFSKWYANKNNRQAFEAVEHIDRILLRLPTLQPLTDMERAKDDYDGSISVLRWTLVYRRNGRSAREVTARRLIIGLWIIVVIAFTPALT